MVLFEAKGTTEAYSLLYSTVIFVTLVIIFFPGVTNNADIIAEIEV